MGVMGTAGLIMMVRVTEVTAPGSRAISPSMAEEVRWGSLRWGFHDRLHEDAGSGNRLRRAVHRVRGGGNVFRRKAGVPGLRSDQTVAEGIAGAAFVAH